MDLLELYDDSSMWTRSKIEGAVDQLDAPTACVDWAVRDLVNHLLHARELFVGAAAGRPAGPPTGKPPALMGSDPVADYEAARRDVLEAYRKEGAVEQAGMMLGIAVVDTLVHGWDLAKGTGQDTAMPLGLAEAAFALIDGRLDDPTSRGDYFAEAIEVADDAPVQDKLVAYLGRQP